MNKPSRAELAAWAVGAVEPDRAAEIAEQVRLSPALRAWLGRLRDRPEAKPQPAPRGPPPPGLRMRGMPVAQIQQSGVLGLATTVLRPGARFEVHLDAVPEPERRVVVVYYRLPSGWVQRFPRSPKETLPVAELPRDAEGRHVLELSAAPEPGRQRWNIALPLADDDLWGEALLDALGSGRVPTVTFEIEVAERR